MKQYHYSIVSRYLYMLDRQRLALIVGLQGAFGTKEYYTKKSVLILTNCTAR
jgi:hypothetical protein